MVDADIDPGLGAGEGRPSVAGVLEGAVEHLKEEPLLRVDDEGFLGRDAEERRVELGDLGQVPHRGVVGVLVRPGDPERVLDVVGAGAGHGPDARPSLDEVGPELLLGRGLGEGALETDDGDVGATPLGIHLLEDRRPHAAVDDAVPGGLQEEGVDVLGRDRHS